MTEVPLDATVVAATDLVACDLAGDTAILHLKSGVYFTLNSVGTAVWTLIQQPARVRDVQASLLDRYEVDPETCTRYLLSFLGDLSANDLLCVQP